MITTSILFMGMIFLAVYLSFRMEGQWPHLTKRSTIRVFFYALMIVGMGSVLLGLPSTSLSESRLFLFLLYGLSLHYWGGKVSVLALPPLFILDYINQGGRIPIVFWSFQYLLSGLLYAYLRRLVRQGLKDFGILIGLALSASLSMLIYFWARDGLTVRMALLSILVSMLAYTMMGLLHLVMEDLRKLGYRIDYDDLTQVKNVGKFNRDLSTFHNQLSPLTVVLIDIDFFKEHNDQFGHEAGDIVLKSIAQRLNLFFGDSQSTIYRIGGDEFALLIRGETVTRVGEKLEEMIGTVHRQDILYEWNPISVTLSIGVAQALEKEAVDDTVKRADAALYEAKEKGRGCIQFA